MRAHRTTRRSPAGKYLVSVVLILLLGAFECNGVRKDYAKVNRLLLVVDPTVLRDVDTAEFNRQVTERLHKSLGQLPEETHVDMYLVGQGQTGRPADYRASLPFAEDETSEQGHLLRADSVGESVANLVQAAWEESNEQPNEPSSCILSALYRTQEMTKLGREAGEDVTLVVVSDFLEACAETGLNFERSIPDSVGPLPVEADLSGAKHVLMLRMQTSGAVTLDEEPRLLRLWTDVLQRWQVNPSTVRFTPNFPETLVPVT